ncbi:MAG: hypothetical protein HRT35_18470, partial [Algicola sp.]|nr:hypothetical protein [Algicola sp.]
MNTQLTQGLVLGLTLDDIPANNMITDLSSNGYEAQIVGQPTLVPDEYFGCCFDFAGSAGQCIKVDNIENPSEEAVTIACWVKSTNSDNSAAVFTFTNEHSDNGFSLLRLSNLSADINGTVTQSSTALNDGQWHHIAVTWIKNTEKVMVHIDAAEALDTWGELSTESLLSKGCLVLGQRDGDSEAFQGQMAHVYVYDKVLKQEEILALMAANQTAQATFKQEYPVDFKLVDDNEDNVLYISDSQTNNTVNLQLQNCSLSNLSLNDLSGNASAGNHHFCLTFKSKTFNSALNNGDSNSAFIAPRNDSTQWDISHAQLLGDGRVAVYLLYTGDGPLLLVNDETLNFTFEYTSADGDAGARGTSVALDFKNLSFENDLPSLTGTRIKHIDIINHRGKKDIPLFASIVGSNTILNEASAENKVVIRLVNTLPATDENGVANQLSFNHLSMNSTKDSKFSIVFDNPVGDDWDLASTDDLDVIEAGFRHVKVGGGKDDLTDLEKTNQNQTPIFSFDAPVPTLHAGDSFDIELSNIRSHCKSGFANIYIHYEDIPGYWDGHFVVQVEKSPIVHKNVEEQNNVGIGQMPDAKHRLSIGGDFAVDGKVKERNDEDGQYYDLVPAGTVVMWHNPQPRRNNPVPNGWALCDGGKYTYGDDLEATTPDLRGKFVIGANQQYPVSDTGGSDVIAMEQRHMPSHGHQVNEGDGHLHTVDDPGHNHNFTYTTVSNRRLLNGSVYDGTSFNMIMNHVTKSGIPDEQTNLLINKTKTNIGIENCGDGEEYEYLPPYYSLYYIVKKLSSYSKSPPPPDFYTFAEHLFTNCGSSSSSGPSVEICKSLYNATAAWVINPEFFAVSGGIQQWTVPANGVYQIQARGAQGGSSRYNSGGRGAIIQGEFNLNQGEIIHILVGQKGIGTDEQGNGGGGGSFVLRAPYNDSNAILLIAGGGGGAGYNEDSGQVRPGGSGVTAQSAGNASKTNSGDGNSASGNGGGGKSRGGNNGYGGGSG